MLKNSKALQPYLLVAPQTLVFVFFLILPIAAIVVVSFWNFNGFAMIPGFTLNNYLGIFTSKVYLASTVPFLTSNIIRMISWVPFLGREGLINKALMGLHLTNQPIEMFLFSDFAVILAMVHLYALFMVAPIFNSMMRIDRSLIAAAEDLGASQFQIQKEIVLPLSAAGIAIGSIFIVTLVMGEFATMRIMSGGKSSSVGYLIKNQLDSLQYPMAAANAVVLLIVTLLIVFGILRAVDIRKEL